MVVLCCPRKRLAAQGPHHARQRCPHDARAPEATQHGGGALPSAADDARQARIGSYDGMQLCAVTPGT